MVRAENLALVREIYDEWARGDFGGSVERWAPDVRYRSFAAEGDDIAIEGLGAMIAWHREFFSTWRNFRIEVREIVDAGDRVFVVAHQSGEGRESGVAIDMPVYQVWAFRDGRVAEFIATRHRDEALAAAGLSTPHAPSEP